MSYDDLLEEENLNSQFLMVLSPRRRESGFAVFSGSVYSVFFDFGFVSGVSIDGVDLSSASSPSLAAGQFYWNNADQALYVRLSDDSDPNLSFSVVTYEIYAATFDQHWYRDPLDSDSEPAYFEPIVPKSLDIKTSTDDNFMGYMPVQSSSITFSNAFHIFEKHVYDSSFNRASIKVWRLLDELAIENIKLVYDGFMGDVSYEGSTVSVKCYNTIDELSNEFRNDETSFLSTDDFPNLNPSFVGKPARFVYGRVDGFVPVNVDYVAEGFTTSDNRDYVVVGVQNDLPEIDTPVLASPASTATRTYIAVGHGIMAGDRVWLDRAIGTDEFVEVTIAGSNYIEHETLGSGAMTSADSVKRGFVASVNILHENVNYKAFYGRDYLTNTGLAADCSGFIFTNNFEATLSMPEPLSPLDRIYCRVYGVKNTVTLGGPSFGSNDSDSGNLTNPCVVIVDLLKRVAGIDESRLDIPSFTSALAERTDALGFAIPSSSSGGFPNVKTIITNILKTSLVKLYINDDIKYALSAHGPMDSADLTIEDEEIIYQKIAAGFEYKDIVSKVTVKYNSQEATDETSAALANADEVFTESDVAKYIHNVEKEKSFESLHFKEADAQKLADRLSYIYGDRQGSMTIQAKNRFYGMQVSNVLAVDRTKLPGFDFDDETLRQRSFLVTGTQKNLNSIVIEAIDNKGVEENDANW